MHMQPEVHYGVIYLIETRNGTQVLPADLVGNFDPEQHGFGSEEREDFLSSIQQYCDGWVDDDADITAMECWYGRMSAPGFLDCTDWVYSQSSKKELLEDLGF